MMQPSSSGSISDVGIPLAQPSRQPEPLPPLPSSSGSAGSPFRTPSPGDRFFIFGAGAPPIRTNRRPDPLHGHGADRWRPAQFREALQQAGGGSSGPPPLGPPLSMYEIESRCFCCYTLVRCHRQSPAFTCAVCGTVCDLVPPRQPKTRSRLDKETLVHLAESLSNTSSSDSSEVEVEVQKLLDDVFDDVEALNTSFRSERTGDIDGDLLAAFNALFDDRPRMLDKLVAATRRVVTRPGAALVESDALWAVVLLQSPVLRTNTHAVERAFVLSHLFGLIGNLPEPQQETVIAYYASTAVEKDDLTRHAEIVTSFMSSRIRACLDLPEPGAYLNDWSLQTACKTAALFFLANRRNPRISITSFYCTVIDGLGGPLLQQAFELWENRPDRFSICHYPFIMSLGVKIWLLSFDGERQMKEKVREAIRSTLLYHQLVQPFLVLYVRRDRIVQDSLEQISAKREELKKKLRIIFDGEQGVDAGGLTKEWFLVLCRQLFDPQYGMFVYDEDTNLAFFSPTSLESEDEYYLVGAVVGLAIYNSVTLDVPLPLAVYKKLTNEPCGLRDLAQMRPSLARGLQQLIDFEGDVEETFARTFVVESEVWGEVQEVELVPHGKDIAVTEENRKEYVEEYVRYLLDTSVRAQFDAFAAGFKSVTSGNALPLFVGAELELLVRGSTEPLDLDQLKSVTVYEGFDFGEHDSTAKLFWQAFESFDSTQQRQLLSFVTGSDRIPATGTSALTLKLTLLSGEDTTRLPQAHTCFNQLCLYRYPNLSTMRERLLVAMTETCVVTLSAQSVLGCLTDNEHSEGFDLK